MVGMPQGTTAHVAMSSVKTSVPLTACHSRGQAQQGAVAVSCRNVRTGDTVLKQAASLPQLSDVLFPTQKTERSRACLSGEALLWLVGHSPECFVRVRALHYCNTVASAQHNHQMLGIFLCRLPIT